MSPKPHGGGRPRRNLESRPSPQPQRPAAPRLVAPQPPAPQPPAQEPTSFAALGVPAPIAAALARTGITTPFPIQSATLPDALAGRDVLGRARTGSGKTIAFAVPLAGTLLAPDYRRTPTRPGALVLVPTRELAAQVARTVTPLAEAVGLRCATVFGGVSQGPQTAALRRGVDILVATPGRLEDLIAQRQCALDRVRITVLDEADLMADLGFLPAVRRLLDQTPPDGQRLMFSATLDAAVAGIADRYLHDPAEHSVDPAESSVELLEHHLFTVQTGDKAAVVAELAGGVDRTLLFTRTKHGARKLARHLSSAGIPAAELHGNLSQPAREQNLASFSAGRGSRPRRHRHRGARHPRRRHLARRARRPAGGAQVLPASLGSHRSAGAAGSVVTIATPEQARSVAALFRKANVRPNTATVRPGDPRTLALAGPTAERRLPPPVSSLAKPAPRTSGKRPTTGSRQGRQPRGPRRAATRRSA